MQRKFNQLTSAEKAALIDTLEKTDNIHALLSVLINRFDLQQCKPGGITKALLARNLVNTVLPMLNPFEK